MGDEAGIPRTPAATGACAFLTVTTWCAEGGRPVPANMVEGMRKGLPLLLTVSCILVGVQAASFLAFAAFGLTLATSQRMLIDEISGSAQGGLPSLTIAIGSGVIGLLLAGLIVMLARRSRLGRWLTAALELLMLLCGLVLFPENMAIGFFDPISLWFTAATAAAALILFSLIVNRGVRRYFTFRSATAASLSP